MNEMIRITEREGELFADSRDVAEILGIRHRNLLLLAEKHESSIGFVAFETQAISTPKGDRETRYAIFSERQALIVLTLVRNTKDAEQAKVGLVDAFISMRKRLESRMIRERIDRMTSAEKRREFTDILKEHGVNAAIEYMKLTATMKKNAGIPGNKKKKDFTQLELEKIAIAETLAVSNIEQAGVVGYEKIKPICRKSAALIAEGMEKPLIGEEKSA